MTIQPNSADWKSAVAASRYTVSPEASTSGLLEGTMVWTPWGAQFVEHLVPGDLVTTEEGHVVHVARIRRCRLHNVEWLPTRLRPVKIAAGAFGEASPRCDIVVGGDHVLIVDGSRITAANLVGRDGIDFVPLADMPKVFTYWQIETEIRETLLVEGGAFESNRHVARVGRRAPMAAKARQMWDSTAGFLFAWRPVTAV